MEELSDMIILIEMAEEQLTAAESIASRADVKAALSQPDSKFENFKKGDHIEIMLTGTIASLSIMVDNITGVR